MRPLALSLAVTAVVAAVVPATANALSVPETVPTSSYIVTTDGPAAPVLGLVRALGGDIGFVYASALDGFSVSLPAPSLPLSGSLTTAATGAGVKAYVVDTGIRLDHEDFRGRVLSGFDAVDGGPADDCNGHGTHVAGTTGGTRFGVAKGVTLVAVRVLGCDGSGATSGVIAGADYVTGNHAAGQPAVANMSLGGGASAALDAAVQGAINDGVSFAVAAGNSGGLVGDLTGQSNACNSSPARVPAALTVGATDVRDAKASYSNKGTCLDLFAPGTNITSAWSTGPSATNTISGTSMASPLVVGVAALFLQTSPGATPAQVSRQLITTSTPNVVTSPGTGSPNRLLFTK